MRREKAASYSTVITRAGGPSLGDSLERAHMSRQKRRTLNLAARDLVSFGYKTPGAAGAAAVEVTGELQRGGVTQLAPRLRVTM